jgi:hypothetical protein
MFHAAPANESVAWLSRHRIDHQLGRTVQYPRLEDVLLQSGRSGLLSTILLDETLKYHTHDLSNRSTSCCTVPSKYLVPGSASDTCLRISIHALLYNEHKATLGLAWMVISLLLEVDMPVRHCIYIVRLVSSRLVEPHSVAFVVGRGGLSMTGCSTVVSWTCGSSVFGSSTSGSKES